MTFESVTRAKDISATFYGAYYFFLILGYYFRALSRKVIFPNLIHVPILVMNNALSTDYAIHAGGIGNIQSSTFVKRRRTML